MRDIFVVGYFYQTVEIDQQNVMSQFQGQHYIREPVAFVLCPHPYIFL